MEKWSGEHCLCRFLFFLLPTFPLLLIYVHTFSISKGRKIWESWFACTIEILWHSNFLSLPKGTTKKADLWEAVVEQG